MKDSEEAVGFEGGIGAGIEHAARLAAELQGIASPESRPSGEQLINERNDWLEQTLDPDKSLPSVEVVILDGNMQHCEKNLPVDHPFRGNSGSIYLHVPESQNAVADLVYGEDPSLPGKLIVTDVSAPLGSRGRGYGKRLYLEALKALPPNTGLVSHSMLSEDGERMWKWLVESGVARARSDPTERQIGKYETVF